MSVDRRAAESLLSFWTDAGVDTLYGEAAVDRMAAPATPPKLVRPDLARPSPRPQSLANAGVGRELAAAAADLDALAAAIATYDGCDLKTQGARQAVFCRGAADAAVMIIGEGPGAEEDAQGAPFVGRAGRLLDKMMTAAGLEGRVFITNTVFWRPPGNRTPTVEEQLACAPFLERAIELVRPKVLLLVGAAAAKSLLDRSEGILALRGRWFEWRANFIELEIPALPTLHPAFLLRQPAAKKRAWQDLLLLAERVDRTQRPS